MTKKHIETEELLEKYLSKEILEALDKIEIQEFEMGFHIFKGPSGTKFVGRDTFKPKLVLITAIITVLAGLVSLGDSIGLIRVLFQGGN